MMAAAREVAGRVIKGLSRTVSSRVFERDM
jgi:hypothetical protein